jgi:probable F420-dependent oxidoreductase
MKFCIPTAFMDPLHLPPLARAAEEAGVDSFAISDHVVHPERISSRYPYAETGERYWDAATPWPDPWVTIGALSAITKRLRFFTNVFILPARNPFLVAKAVGTAAVLSGNRVALGIGVGWMSEEFELLGQEFAGRGRRTDEAIEVLRRLWTGKPVEYHGQCFSFPPTSMSPAPSAPIPIYGGGLSKPAFRRAARLLDGWIAVIHSAEEIRAMIGELRRLREEHGRANLPFEIVGTANDAFGLDGYRRLEDIGVTTVLTLPWIFYGADPTSVVEKCDAVRRFGDEVISRMP